MRRWLPGLVLLLVDAAGIYVVTRPAPAPPKPPVEVRLEPPRIEIISTPRVLSHGGSSLVVYRVTPPESHSGVRVGDVEYRGFPVRTGGPSGADSGDRAAFFALLPEQDLHVPAFVFARSTDGTGVRTAVADDRVETAFRQTRMLVDDRLFAQLLPAIFEHAPQARVRRSIDNPNDPLGDFLNVNGPLRRVTLEQIAQLTDATSPERLWDGPFIRLWNKPRDAAFGDNVTYVYQGRNVDQQRHLGFNLRVPSGGPVLAANSGKVLSAGWLGLYGNAVVVDHGMGVASLYGHLSAIDVKAGDSVVKGGSIGRGGSTGLADGDQLHFAMFVGGHAVTPTQWWDPGWIDRNVEREPWYPFKR